MSCVTGVGVDEHHARVVLIGPGSRIFSGKSAPTCSVCASETLFLVNSLNEYDCYAALVAST